MNTYKLRDTDLFFDVAMPERQYVLKIHDLPTEDKPREKLLANGPRSLTVQELMAVVLITGTKKEGVLEMSSRILKEYGEHSLSGYVNPKQLAADLNIPLVKATQIVACSELGRRFFDKKSNGNVMIRTAKDVHEYVRDMHNLQKEHLRGLYLNCYHQLVHDEVLSIGTVNSNIVHPREVFRPAVQYNAAAVILVHNHPSGKTQPSEADIEITKQLVQAGRIMGINLLDHIIVSGDKFSNIEISYE